MRFVRAIVGAMCACVLTGAAAAGPSPRWIATWGTAQLPLEAKDALPEVRGDRGVTLRQTVRVSAAGKVLRVRLSNAFGTQPLDVARARLSSTGGAVALSFAGRGATTIPAGAAVYSDAVPLTVAAGADVTITLHLPRAPEHGTGHPGARATSMIAPGDRVDAATPSDAAPLTRWFHIADVEVQAAPIAGTIVAIGDSITDGYGVAPDSNTRWTDVFASRLRGSTALSRWGVVNAGIGGNRVTADGLGPNLLARFDRDVIARSGVKTAIVLEGVNDLGTLTREKPATPAEHAALVRRITAGYAEIARRAHAHGIRVIGGTITPFVGNDYYHADASNEADRQAVNAFIRTSGTFDAVVDFDKALRDPAHADRLAAAYDSGDHLHPSAAGYAAMAAAVPLALIAAPLPVAKAATTRAGPSLAMTFDDLPRHGDLPPGETRAGVVRAIVAALKAGGVPAYGFLNAGVGAGEADAAAATAAWRAGFPVGNHGFAHRRLDDLDRDGFRDQLVRNEAAVGTGATWFRYPYLSEGATPGRRDMARAILSERGYRIAAVTASFADYDYNGPYARCVATRDAAGVVALERHWLAAVRADAAQQRARAQALFGREVPLVLLMHVGAFDARMMPRTIALYRAMGFRFVSLEQAQADPVYAAANDPAMPGPSPSFDRLSMEAGIAVPSTRPAIDFGKLCQ